MCGGQTWDHGACTTSLTILMEHFLPARFSCLTEQVLEARWPKYREPGCRVLSVSDTRCVMGTHVGIEIEERKASWFNIISEDSYVLQFSRSMLSTKEGLWPLIKANRTVLKARRGSCQCDVVLIDNPTADFQPLKKPKVGAIAEPSP